MHVTRRNQDSRLCNMLVQDPVTLLLLGPTAKGGPGLLGVATLSLHIEDAQHDFSNTCSSCAQPLPLISPAGEKIGSITAAARIICCQPAVSTQPASQASQDSVGSTTARLSRNDRSAPAALQGTGQRAHDSTLSVYVEESAPPLRTVSAAVQTDDLEAQDNRSTSLQPLQVPEAQAGAAARTLAESEDAQLSPPPQVPYVMQCPHFHIYPPGHHTLPAAPREQHPLHLPPVINISQPVFNFSTATQGQVQAALSATALSQTDAAQAQAKPVTDDTEQKLQQLAPAEVQVLAAEAQKLQELQPAVAQASAPDETNQPAGAESVQMVQAAEDLESWRPMTSVPWGNTTAGHDKQSNGTVTEASAESVMTGQYCSGAHELTLKQPKPCNHQVLPLLPLLCHAYCAVVPLPTQGIQDV